MLGLEPLEKLVPPKLDGEPALLGATYVLEGSRLGAAVLRKTVPPQFPSRFLSAPTVLKWSAFAALLDDRLSTEVELNAAVTAAQNVFKIFHISATKVALDHGFAPGLDQMAS